MKYPSFYIDETKAVKFIDANHALIVYYNTERPFVEPESGLIERAQVLRGTLKETTEQRFKDKFDAALEPLYMEVYGVTLSETQYGQKPFAFGKNTPEENEALYRDTADWDVIDLDLKKSA